jgi:hypothetical protein
MKKRCTNPKAHNYRYYGGRGITVCDRWSGVDGFPNFLSDMGEPPTPKHSIDRIDGNLGYSPENCRWATINEQQRNKSNNVLIEYNGETKTLTEWCELLDLSCLTMRSRLLKGWTAERAFTEPVNNHYDSKLTEVQVLDILTRLSKGEKQLHIARSTGIHKATINDIHRRKTWAHLSINF